MINEKLEEAFNDQINKELYSEYLYFTINVKDDYVVTPFCDTCVSESIEVWLDVHDYLKSGERIATIQNETPLFNNKAKTGIYKFEIRAGNFVTQPATIIMSSSDELNSMQKLAALNGGMEKDAISLNKWLGAYGKRLSDVIAGKNYGVRRIGIMHS